MEETKKNKKLPVFRGYAEYATEIIDGKEVQTGVNAVGFVDAPATDFKWVAFDETKPLNFAVDKERRIVSGIAMVANMPIYRNDNGFEYYIEFDKEDIFNLVKFFFKSNSSQSVNLYHDEQLKQENVYVIESLWLDKERGMSIPEKFGKPTDGSWFLSFAVDNADLWENYIKSGKVLGFSVEGLFKQYKIDEKNRQQLENLHNRIAAMRKQLANL